MKKLLLVLSFVIGVFALSQYANAHGGPRHGYYTRDVVRCESINHNYRTCGSYEVRRIDRVRLVRQHSKAPCMYGQTWGIGYWDIWVSNGCRGTFEILGWAR